jgi:hypothetical protein
MRGWNSYSYGQMPSRAVFDKHWEREVGPNDYFMHLKGEDADVGDIGGYLGPGTYDEDEIWDMVNALNDNGGDEAMNLASSILYTLKIEWI